ncbi:hypothetical protein [Actinomadura harenae]|uniref:Secreted protein n=1 Tax=Actinomadura harenae TaxID=2483351 RepID=A0A3M2LKL7_9ACTN|nr:hypothetical protein [Actinomadura harenae]RMI36575.1 hypothetical protein EBO15_38260 [Actinomadura harenae]
MKTAPIILAAGLVAGPVAAAAPAGAAVERTASYECSGLSSSLGRPAEAVGQNCEAAPGSPTRGRFEGRVKIAVPLLGSAHCRSVDLRDYPEKIVGHECTYEIGE